MKGWTSGEGWAEVIVWLTSYLATVKMLRGRKKIKTKIKFKKMFRREVLAGKAELFGGTYYVPGS